MWLAILPQSTVFIILLPLILIINLFLCLIYELELAVDMYIFAYSIFSVYIYMCIHTHTHIYIVVTHMQKKHSMYRALYYLWLHLLDVLEYPLVIVGNSCTSQVFLFQIYCMEDSTKISTIMFVSLIHIGRSRRLKRCRKRWSPEN